MKPLNLLVMFGQDQQISEQLKNNEAIKRGAFRSKGGLTKNSGAQLDQRSIEC